VKVTKTLSLNNFIVRLASLGAVWQQGVIPQEQTTRWTGGYDFGRAGLGLVGEWRVGGASGGGVAVRPGCPPFALSGTRGES